MKLTFVRTGDTKNGVKNLMFTGETTTKATSLGNNVVVRKYYFTVPEDEAVALAPNDSVEVSDDEFSIVPIGEGIANMIYAK